MAKKQWFTRSAGALVLAVIAGPVQSGPIGIIKSTDALTTSPERVAYRICTTQGGVRRCRWINIYGPGAYGYQPYGYYGPTDPEYYRTGTGRWWQGMDRLNRGGGAGGGSGGGAGAGGTR
jgi:hypothetical protein